MSTMNMSMKLGHLDINIKIKRDQEKINQSKQKRIKHDIRIQKIMNERKDIEVKHSMYNLYL